MSSVFTRIINRELPAEVIFENDKMMAIKDIAPQAPVHVLLFPKKEISSFHCMQKEDQALLSEMMQVVKEIAKDQGIENGYRLLTNIGEQGGQSVYHLHFHILGGKQLGSFG